MSIFCVLDIYVAYDTEKKRIASTLKVYKRQFYMNGSIHDTGGLGMFAYFLIHKYLDFVFLCSLA